jgi:hypothetical protein
MKQQVAFGLDPIGDRSRTGGVQMWRIHALANTDGVEPEPPSCPPSSRPAGDERVVDAIDGALNWHSVEHGGAAKVALQEQVAGCSGEDPHDSEMVEVASMLAVDAHDAAKVAWHACRIELRDKRAATVRGEQNVPAARARGSGGTTGQRGTLGPVSDEGASAASLPASASTSDEWASSGSRFSDPLEHAAEAKANAMSSPTRRTQLFITVEQSMQRADGAEPIASGSRDTTAILPARAPQDSIVRRLSSPR